MDGERGVGVGFGGMRRIETREKEEISDKKFNKYKGFNKG